ncbi:MAG TPA: hypothetical protein PKL17_11570 [Pseudomonadota bacterium]|nr:hypothetical protein [Pseudomonadota bacterium]
MFPPGSRHRSAEPLDVKTPKIAALAGTFYKAPCPPLAKML